MNTRSVTYKVISLSLFVCALLFFIPAYPAHIQFQEQYQLFEFGWDYFGETVSVPGGFADWCGRFLTQFFIVPRVGALIISAIILLFFLLVRKTSENNSVAALILSVIPAISLFSFFLSDKSLVGGAMAILIPTAASVFLKRVNKGALRTTLILAGIPLLYCLCGPAAVIFALLIPDDETIPVKVITPVILLLCPVAAQYFVHYPIERLCCGIHYVRIPSEFPTVLWITVLSVLSVHFFSRYITSPFYAAAILLAGCTTLIPSIPEIKKEDTMRYETSVRSEKWDEIIQMARHSNPRDALSVSGLNLALAMTGQLPECQFSFFQSGEEGLFPHYTISYRTLPNISEIYWQLGMVNACQQYIFDAQEAIPDFQKSGRCYKRLAETNLVNGDYKVSEKYLNALCRTVFYRRWALETLELLKTPSAIDNHPVYGRLRRLRSHDATALFNENNKFSACLELLEHNPDNSVAEQYLFSLLLLENDFEGFMKRFRAERYGKVPKHYQEALILICIDEHKSLESISGIVSEKNINRMKSFIADMKTGVQEEMMEKRYGDTYWYYSIFK